MCFTKNLLNPYKVKTTSRKIPSDAISHPSKGLCAILAIEEVGLSKLEMMAEQTLANFALGSLSHRETMPLLMAITTVQIHTAARTAKARTLALLANTGAHRTLTIPSSRSLGLRVNAAGGEVVMTKIRLSLSSFPLPHVDWVIVGVEQQ